MLSPLTTLPCTYSLLVSAAGLVPILGLPAKDGLHEVADTWLNVATDNVVHAGAKVASLVGGMVAVADPMDDMSLRRHGGMRRLFITCYARYIYW